MTIAGDLPDASQSATPLAAIDQSIAELKEGARRLASSSLDERVRWARECVNNTYLAAADWVREAVRAKRLPPLGSAVAEEILGGPTSVLRFLQLTIQTLHDLQSSGQPRLPRQPYTAHGQVRVATFPTRTLYDSLVFRSISAETWLQPDVSATAIFGDAPARLTRRLNVSPRLALVLGAGNVAAIPVTDALTMIFQNDCAVLLKMNPVNEYLGPVFVKSLQPLIQAGFLRIIYGGTEQGGYGVNDPRIDLIHITGSAESHDAIVWGRDSEEQRQRKQLGQPLVTKPVSSELGNVTPWIIVPGEYSDSQLASQAENIAASIINNASFNCIASKMLVTWKQWPARERFLDLISAILQRTPARYAYYPGAAARYCDFSGGQQGPDDQGRLPWTLRRGVDREREPHLFGRESFVCVTGETSIDADSPVEFLDKAVEFANEHIWGSLAVALTVPDSMRKKHAADLDAAIRRLCYGTVGLNQWPGVAYGLMSPPWGAYPDATLSRVQSGIGFVHNIFLLNRPQKTVLRSPLTLSPKPVWFSTNRRAEPIAWRLTAMYGHPSLSKLLPLFGEALRG
jgi:hypothetical protein